MHSDLHGPVAAQAIGGPRYFAITIDNKSCKMFVYLLKHKDNYPAHFKELKVSVEALTGKKIKHLQTNRGGEYGSNAFKAWMRAEGTKHQKTKENLSSSNGVAEQTIRTMNDCQRAMHEDAKMPDKFWGYVINHAAYLWNVTPKRFLDGRTPEEAFTGKIPDVTRLQTFGCRAWGRVPDDKHTKLQARLIECTHLGFGPNRKAHTLMQRPTGRIFILCNVVFDEGAENCQRVIIADYNEAGVPEAVGDAELVPKVEADCTAEKGVTYDIPTVTKPPDSVKKSSKSSEIVEETLPKAKGSPSVEKTVIPPRSSPITRPPVAGDDPRFAITSYQGHKRRRQPEAVNATLVKTAPETFDKAMSHEDSNLWLSAMLEEMSLFDKHGVWKSIPRPKNKNIVKCRWIYSVKRGVDSEIERYKARLVAKGFSQRPGVDYGEISLPVAAADSYQALLATVASEDLELLQLDIKTVFLHRVLDEEIYMEQPDWFNKEDGLVWLLVKALHGLKQAARVFYQQLREVLEGLGFTLSETDHAVFWRREGANIEIILAHVDDMLLAGRPIEFLESIKAELGGAFKIVDLCKARMFVGVEILQNRAAKTLKTSQLRYIDDILHRFHMSNCRTGVDMPMAKALCLPKLHSPTVDHTLYQRGVGSLMYAMISTQADITYTTGVLAQHASNPGEEHWSAFKRVLQYLQGTKEFGITYDGLKPSKLLGFVDADYTGNKNTSRSTSGWVFLIAGGSVAWSLCKQPTISLLSTKAAHVAAASAARELIWL